LDKKLSIIGIGNPTNSPAIQRLSTGYPNLLNIADDLPVQTARTICRDFTKAALG
jgi:hypothetical protein